MSGARIVELDGRHLGIAVPLSPGRFRFFSSSPVSDALDGRIFRSVAAAVRAAERLPASADRRRSAASRSTGAGSLASPRNP